MSNHVPNRRGRITSGIKIIEYYDKSNGNFLVLELEQTESGGEKYIQNHFDVEPLMLMMMIYKLIENA